MWPNPQETADLVTFTEESLNRKLSDLLYKIWWSKILTYWKIYAIETVPIVVKFSFLPFSEVYFGYV